MSYRYSNSSRSKLDTCDERLQEIFNEAIKYIDITIVQGHRSKEEQNKYYREGKSEVQYPNSKHNSSPAKAVDAAPYVSGEGIPWQDDRYFYYLAGIVMAIAKSKGINLRFGGDWDRDNNFSDQSFNDLVHYEIVE